MPEQKSVRGGFVHFDANAQPSRVVAFQFNPELLERTVIPVDPDNQQRELIRFTLELDASDALERGDPAASAVGIHHVLAALELLAQASKMDSGQLAAGTSKRSGKGAAFTLFVWGNQRVIPVRFAHLTVRETMFDKALNPVRAAVDITLEILTDAELVKNVRAKSFMDSYLKQKESLARQPGSGGLADGLLAAIKNKPPG